MDRKIRDKGEEFLLILVISIRSEEGRMKRREERRKEKMKSWDLEVFKCRKRRGKVTAWVVNTGISKLLYKLNQKGFSMLKKYDIRKNR